MSNAVILNLRNINNKKDSTPSYTYLVEIHLFLPRVTLCIILTLNRIYRFTYTVHTVIYVPSIIYLRLELVL